MSRFTHGGSGPSKKAIILATAVVAGLAAIVTTLPNSGVLPKSWTSEAEAASIKVTICHRTRSVTNPYRQP